MSRRAARTDGNHAGLVKELRAIGANVFDASGFGEGFPDLVVAYQRVNYLVEVKDPDKPPSKRKLTPAQKKFFAAWAGPRFVVETLEGFLEEVNRHEKRVV